MNTLWVEAILRAGLLLVCGDVCLRLLRDREIALESRIRRALVAWALAMPLVVFVWPRADAATRVAEQGWRVGETLVAPIAAGLPSWAMAAYLLVSAVLLLRLVVGMAYVGRLWAQARPIDVGCVALTGRVRESDAVVSPVSIGAGVILPVRWREWSADDLRMVLAHERSHLERRDYTWAVLVRLHRAVFWINPWSWVFETRLRTIAERLSDRAAIQSTGRRDEYISLLLACAESQIRPSLLPAMARGSELADRIALIVRGEDAPFAGRIRAAVIAAAVSVLTLGSAFSPTLRLPTRVSGVEVVRASVMPRSLGAMTSSLTSLGSLSPLSTRLSGR